MFDIIYYLNKIIILILLHDNHYYHVFLFMLCNLSISKQSHINNNLFISIIVITTTYSIIEYEYNFQFLQTYIYRFIIATCNMYQLLSFAITINTSKIFLTIMFLTQFYFINIMTNKQLLTLFITQNLIFI